VKAGERAGFALKKRTQNHDLGTVLRALKQLLPRPALRFGLRRDLGHGRLRDPRFVSFVAQSNRRTLNTDFRDAVLRGRVLVRRALVAAAVLGAAWIALESAQALSVF
jgi:hypothetical protein